MHESIPTVMLGDMLTAIFGEILRLAKQLMIIGFIFLFSTGSYAQDNLPPAQAIASAHPLATHAGLKILQKGGNAFDAAVTISAVLAVVEPFHTSLGAGGFWLLHDEKTKKNIFIDGRETAPHAGRVDARCGTGEAGDEQHGEGKSGRTRERERGAWVAGMRVMKAWRGGLHEDPPSSPGAANPRGPAARGTKNGMSQD